MFMMERIELPPGKDRAEIVVLDDDLCSRVRQHVQRPDDIRQVFDLREHVGKGDDVGLPELGDEAPGDVLAEKRVPDPMP